jgi:hypothetical protein
MGFFGIMAVHLGVDTAVNIKLAEISQKEVEHGSSG